MKLDPLKGLALLEFGGHTFRFTTDLKSDTIYMEIDGKMIECHPRELMTLHQAITFSLACMDPDYAQQVIKFDPAAAPDSDVF